MCGVGICVEFLKRYELQFNALSSCKVNSWRTVSSIYFIRDRCSSKQIDRGQITLGGTSSRGIAEGSYIKEVKITYLSDAARTKVAEEVGLIGGRFSQSSAYSRHCSGRPKID